MRTRTEVLLCQLPGHSVQAQGPTEASASDHTQPISCNHSRSVGTTLEHAPQGRGKPVGRPQGREARGLQEADWHVNNHGSHAAQEGPGCIARTVLRDYFVNSALGHHICSLSKWMQLLMTWGALFLPSGGFPLLVSPSLAGPGLHGMFIWLGHSNLGVSLHGSTSRQPL